MSGVSQLEHHLPPWLFDAVRQVGRRARRTRDLRRLAPTLARVRPYTMVPDESLNELAIHVTETIARQVPGDFVECGVWRGGSSFLIALLARQLGQERLVWLFDSFEGLPPPKEIDGQRALEWAEDTESPSFFDNCRASLDQVKAGATALGLASSLRYVKGWFDQTLPSARNELPAIALLRIDADWYSSVRCCLDHLYDKVSPGGVIILDDYYSWEGCAIAVHEFLGERKLAHRILQCGTGAFFRKE